MTILSTGFSLVLARKSVRGSFQRVAPVLAGLSFAFGVWYALGAQGLLPYVL